MLSSTLTAKASDVDGTGGDTTGTGIGMGDGSSWTGGEIIFD